MKSRILKKINNNKFDDYIIDIANRCINYILSNKIKLLSNKEDGSPLTEADLNINKIIINDLENICSYTKIISEENSFSLDTYLEDYYWIIDPIDGTKSYLSGGNEYTINIALIQKGKPYLGLVAHPPTNRIWYAKEKKLKLFKEKKPLIVSDYYPKQCLTIITSKERNKDITNFLNSFKRYRRVEMSSSLKFCELVDKKADLYPRFSSISKWDIAAGHAILNASGGQLVDLLANNITYNNKSSQTGKFIAFASCDLIKILDLTKV